MQSTGLNRDIIDKFYTKPSIAKKCCEEFSKYIKIDTEIDIIIEPSAGNGSFIPQILEMSSTCLFYDIEPEAELILKQDYLDLDFNNLLIPDLYTKIHIIGNPPFGRQSSIAIKFIKKSAEICDTIAFILPKSFKKDSMQKHFPNNFHLIYQVDLEENSFMINQKEKDVPCVFQIWQKQQTPRDIIIKEYPKYFNFVKINENPDISFRRVGVNAGKIYINNFEDNSIQSHYFIKFQDNINKQTIIEKIKNIIYPNDNTVGPKSISKQEIIREFNKLN
jgi:hypothetical protein